MMGIISNAPNGLPVYFLQAKETAYEIHPVRKKKKADKQRWELLRIHANGNITGALVVRATPNACRDVAIESEGKLRRPPIPKEKKKG